MTKRGSRQTNTVMGVAWTRDRNRVVENKGCPFGSFLLSTVFKARVAWPTGDQEQEGPRCARAAHGHRGIVG